MACDSAIDIAMKNEAMRIAVVGTGAMGSVYAVLFAEAGHDVWAIDRWPEHIDVINRDGLKLTGFTGDRTVEVKASISVDDAGSCDMYVLATKVDGVGPSRPGDCAATIARCHRGHHPERARRSGAHLRTHTFRPGPTWRRPRISAPKWWGPDTRTKAACRCCVSVS